MKFEAQDIYECLILFMYRYSYSQKDIARDLVFAQSEFSRKLKLKLFTPLEIRSITEYIEKNCK